jgi:hypothetical protein
MFRNILTTATAATAILCTNAAVTIVGDVPASAQSEEWRVRVFPPPNGGYLLYRIMPSGDPACASYDGRACLWGQVRKQINFNQVQPLVCGADHKKIWGVTGYEDPKHWCSLARSGHPGGPLGKVGAHPPAGPKPTPAGPKPNRPAGTPIDPGSVGVPAED